MGTIKNSQEIVEVAWFNTNSNIKVSSEIIEVGYESSSTNIKVSSEIVEVGWYVPPAIVNCSYAILSNGGQQASVEVPPIINCSVATLASSTNSATTQRVIEESITLTIYLSVTENSDKTILTGYSTLSSSSLSATVTIGQTISCQPVTLSSSGQTGSVVAGAVSINCQSATLSSSTNPSSIIKGTVTVNCNSSTLTSSTNSSILQVEIIINCSTATLASSGEAVAVGNIVIVDCSVATLASSGQSATVQKGGVVVDCSVSTLASSGQSVTIYNSVTVNCQNASLSINGQSATIQVGGITIDCSTATLASSGQSATVSSIATIVDCQYATLTSSAQSTTIQGGAISIDCNYATLASSGEAATISIITEVSCNYATLVSSTNGASTGVGPATLGLRVFWNSTEISHNILSYSYSQRLCTGVGEMDFEVPLSLNYAFETWDTIVIYESSIKKGTFNIETISKSVDTGRVMVKCKDNVKRLEDTFITDMWDVGAEPVAASSVLTHYLDQAGVSYNIHTYEGDSIVAEYSQFGLSTALEIVTSMCKQCGWYFYFDGNGVCQVDQRGLSSASLTVSDDDIEQGEYTEDDRMARNKVIIWGGFDPETLVNYYYSEDNSGSWQIDSNDDRIILLSSPYIWDAETATYVAGLLMDEYNSTTKVYNLNVVGDKNIRVGQTLTSTSQYFSGTFIITSIEVNMSEQGLITRLSLDERCPRQYVFYGYFTYNVPEEEYSYVVRSSTDYQFIADENFHTDVSNIGTPKTTNLETASTATTVYYPCRSEENLYYFIRDLSNVYKVIEYNFVTETKTEITLGTYGTGSYAYSMGYLEDRKVAVFKSLGLGSVSSRFVQIDFETEEVISLWDYDPNDTDWYEGDYEYWTSGDYQFATIKYEDNIYLVYASFMVKVYQGDWEVPPYDTQDMQEDGGIFWAVYNYTTSTDLGSTWNLHDATQSVGWNGQSGAMYSGFQVCGNRVIAIPANLDWSMTYPDPEYINTRQPFHLLTLNPMEISSKSIVLIDETQTIDWTDPTNYQCVPDIIGNAFWATVEDFTWDSDPEINWYRNHLVRIDLDSDTVESVRSNWYSYNGYEFTASNENFMFYDGDEMTWYDRNQYPKFTMLEEPATGMYYFDGLCNTFEDAPSVGGRIWMYDETNLARLHGITASGGSTSKIIYCPFDIGLYNRTNFWIFGDVILFYGSNSSPSRKDWILFEAIG